MILVHVHNDNQNDCLNVEVSLSSTSSVLAVLLSWHRAFGIDFVRTGVVFCLWPF